VNKLSNINLVYTGCSKNVISRVTAGGRWEVVYNAIPFQQYTLQHAVAEDAPLVFLGRIERIKGAHTAIAIAKATGNRLILAGNVSPLSDERAYYQTEIAPMIDGEQIQYVGALNDEQKNHYLGKAKALLFPIAWNEPFGMVMTEAMACGTPVIGFGSGSVPEVVKEGVTGFVVSSKEEMIAAVEKLDNINRQQCRVVAEKQFDVQVVAAHYLNLF
jgi:glycosyltransferase involved in cell wall biosynthesis